MLIIQLSKSINNRHMMLIRIDKSKIYNMKFQDSKMRIDHCWKLRIVTTTIAVMKCIESRLKLTHELLKLKQIMTEKSMKLSLKIKS